MYPVRYEDLCREPRETSKQICSWLKVEFEECMLDRTRTTHHYVAGNPRVAKLPKSTEIVLDEKWRN